VTEYTLTTVGNHTGIVVFRRYHTLFRTVKPTTGLSDVHSFIASTGLKKQKPKSEIKMKFKKIKTNEILDLLDEDCMVAHGSEDDGYTVYKMVRFPDGKLKFFSMDYDDEESYSWDEVSEVCLSGLMEDEWYKANV
jgi:hypothetical protein